MARVRRFQRGETVPVWADIKTWAGVYSSPDQGVKVTITDPDGTVQVDAVAMTEDATGKFVYYHLSTTADTVGWWRVRCKAQDGLLVDAKYIVADGGFYLE